jgi:predicted RNA binding protein YcfA (HicA-like mRNA interferase family)
MKRRDIERELRKLGFEMLRDHGCHTIFGNGKIVVPVPRHTEVKENTARSILRRARKGEK